MGHHPRLRGGEQRGVREESGGRGEGKGEGEVYKESQDGGVSCLPGVYGPRMEAGEPDHMESICLRGMNGTWHGGADGPWREAPRAKHVPHIVDLKI